VASLLLILGASLNTKRSLLSLLDYFKVGLGVSLVRLVMMPTVGICLVLLMSYLDLIPRNATLIFVVLLECGTYVLLFHIYESQLLHFIRPSNMFLLVMSQLHGIAELEASSVMMMAYLLAIVTLTLYVPLCLYISNYVSNVM
jgi:hypothetical protein